MTQDGARPLLVDTSALYARFVENAPRHEAAMALFESTRQGERAYRPLYTSSDVCSELAALLLRKAGHGVASECLDAVRTSDAIDVVHLGDEEFERTCASFATYDDQQISFVDHSTAVLADRFDVETVFAFDDDCRTFDLGIVPADLSE